MNEWCILIQNLFCLAFGLLGVFFVVFVLVGFFCCGFLAGVFVWFFLVCFLWGFLEFLFWIYRYSRNVQKIKNPPSVWFTVNQICALQNVLSL